MHPLQGHPLPTWEVGLHGSRTSMNPPFAQPNHTSPTILPFSLFPALPASSSTPSATLPFSTFDRDGQPWNSISRVSKTFCGAIIIDSYFCYHPPFSDGQLRLFWGNVWGRFLDYFVKFAEGYINHLAFFNDYTRHEEMAILCVMTSPVSNKIRKWNSYL